MFVGTCDYVEKAFSLVYGLLRGHLGADRIIPIINYPHFYPSATPMSWKKGIFITTVTGAFLVYGLYLQRRLITERQVGNSSLELQHAGEAGALY